MELEKKFLVCWLESISGLGYVLTNSKHNSFEEASNEFDNRMELYYQNIGKPAWAHPYHPEPEFIIEAWVPKDSE